MHKVAPLIDISYFLFYLIQPFVISPMLFYSIFLQLLISQLSWFVQAMLEKMIFLDNDIVS